MPLLSVKSCCLHQLSPFLPCRSPVGQPDPSWNLEPPSIAPVVTRAHSFSCIVEFRDKAQKLSVAEKFPFFHRILWNCLLTCHKSILITVHKSQLLLWLAVISQTGTVQIHFSDLCLLSYHQLSHIHLLTYHFISHFQLIYSFILLARIL